MNPLRARAFALVILLALPSASAAWSQLAGDASRSSSSPTTTGLLDVVDTLRIAREGERLDFRQQAPLVETSLGLTAILADEDGSCTFVRTEDPPARPHYGRSFSCPQGARVLAYDAARGVLLVCVDGAPGSNVLRAFDASGETQRWTLASAFGGSCVAPAVDTIQGVAYGGFVTTSRADILAIDLDDGAIVRNATLPDSLFARVDSPTGPFRASVVTQAESGFLVSGTWGGAAAVAWLDRDLRPVRGIAAGAPDDIHGSQWAAAQGGSAAIVIGERLLRIDPTREGVDRFPFEIDGPREAPMAHVAWSRDRILAPGSRGMLGYDATSAEGDAWTWDGVPSAQLCDVVAAGEHAYALSLLPAGATRVVVSRLDLASGDETLRLPVQAGATLGNGTACDGFAARLLPSAEGLLVATADGELARLAPSPPEFVPRTFLSNDYPRENGIVELRAERAGALSFVVAWGDGVVQEGRAEHVFSHRYAEPVERTLRVTAVLSDGRTTTSERVVHVGVERPAALTLVERAFSPEWENLTYFIIGLAVTATGALGATVLRGRRHRRLAQEQKELVELQALSARDPPAGLLALEKHREHLVEAHMRHRLDDAQFTLLDQKTVRTMRATRYRLLGRAINELTPHTRRLLDTALEDGRINPGERDALLSALEHEPLSPAEKARVAGLLRDWSVAG